MADPVDSVNSIQIVNLAITGVLSIVTSVLTYLKGRDGLRLDETRKEMESVKVSLETAKQDREDLHFKLAECTSKHIESEKNQHALNIKNMECDKRADLLEQKVSFLEQSIRPRPV